MSGENLPNLSLLDERASDDNDFHEDSNACGGRNENNTNQNNCPDFSLTRPPPRSPSRTPRVVRPPQTSLAQNTNYSNNNNRPLDQLFTSSLHLHDDILNRPQIVTSLYGEPMFPTPDDSDVTSSRTNPPQSLSTHDQLTFTPTRNVAQQSLGFPSPDSPDTTYIHEEVNDPRADLIDGMGDGSSINSSIIAGINQNNNAVFNSSINPGIPSQQCQNPPNLPIFDDGAGNQETPMEEDVAMPHSPMDIDSDELPPLPLVVDMDGIRPDDKTVPMTYGSRHFLATYDNPDGDGNCIFKAEALSTHGNYLHHVKYRVITLLYMINSVYLGASECLANVAQLDSPVPFEVIYAIAKANKLDIYLYDKTPRIWYKFAGKCSDDVADLILLDGDNNNMLLNQNYCLHHTFLVCEMEDVEMSRVQNVTNYEPPEERITDESITIACRLFIKSIEKKYNLISEVIKDTFQEIYNNRPNLILTENFMASFSLHTNGVQCNINTQMVIIFKKLIDLNFRNREVYITFSHICRNIAHFIWEIEFAKSEIDRLLSSIIEKKLLSNEEAIRFHYFCQSLTANCIQLNQLPPDRIYVKAKLK